MFVWAESLAARRCWMRIDKDVAMKTRDGVTLRADVYRPDGNGRFPVLLSRLPYDTTARRGLTGTMLTELERALVPAPTPWAPPVSDEAYRRLPLMAWADWLAPVAPYYTDYLRHPEDGPYWWEINLERRYAEIATPMYHVTSWYDIFLHGGLANFAGLRRHAATESARRAQKLL